MGADKKDKKQAKKAKANGASGYWRQCVAALVVAGVASAVVFFRAGTETEDDFFDWMRAHGAFVHRGIKFATVSHSGAQIRGVITSIDIEKGTEIARIPQKLWLNADAVAPVAFRELDKFHSCTLLEDKITQELLVAVGVANEMRKGKESFFAPMLKLMPSAQDIYDTHPYVGAAAINADFGDLPLVMHLRRHHDAEFGTVHACFQEWMSSNTTKSKPLSLAPNDFNDIIYAWHSIKSRCTTDEKGPSIPAMFDLFNTGNKTQINMKHQTNDIDGIVKMFASKPIPAGSEILNAYCLDCDNELMLAGWGTYLENNKNALNALMAFDCHTRWTPDNRPPAATANSLEEAVLATLDLNQSHEGMRAPRCREDMSGEQQPLRCSLSRYAWERCAAQWGHRIKDIPDIKKASVSARKEHSRIHANFGIDLAGAKKIEEAEEHMRKAVSIYPVNHELHKNLGLILKAQGKSTDALSTLQKAWKMNPGDVKLEEKMGEMLTQMR